ncbi:hypothetical protein TR51_12925 [Kitasatospora griseola]|uniref:Uncharacterized protein n=1 Tax=Kitasatospora griseola TaxID=2064 RepID=A0A0D0PX83_KITGR|nr:hypothetical protein [Kitasatospora griseola]KIQ64977.1 hypothetical protein TR51_12925 [Kitasatospora griseola]
MIAAEALAAERDTPTLCELAGWPRNADARGIPYTFEQALAESGIRLPERNLARRHAPRRMVARFIDGATTPADLTTDDWRETDVELGLDQQTWAAQLRNAALALTSSPPISRGCRLCLAC